MQTYYLTWQCPDLTGVLDADLPAEAEARARLLSEVEGEVRKQQRKTAGARITLEEILRIKRIPRDSYFRWKRRLRRAGGELRALADRSRRPLSFRAARLNREQERRLIAMRKSYPYLGAIKLHYMLVKAA